jgi:mersacidin/lichenicidin family type 2 lantibiotic
MSHVSFSRAGEGAEHRLGLTEAQRPRVLEKPAGLVELSESQLDRVAGGALIGLFRLGPLYLPSDPC